MRDLFMAFVMLGVLAACNGVTYHHAPYRDAELLGQNPDTSPKTVILFFDGTGNDLNSASNVGRLHQMVTNQNRTDIAAFYTSGVGADRTGPVGLATGLGFRDDVQAAFGFLSKTAEPTRDALHIYGYSRGAFAGRALAGLVHTIGLVDMSGLEDDQAREQAFLQELFSAYKFAYRKADRLCPEQAPRLRAICARRKATDRVIADFGLTKKADHSEVTFATVGLWDTVETLGLPERDNPDAHNPRYSDQICNMERVFHAAALDDNRAGPYTPVLMTRKRLVADCDSADLDQITAKVHEVWFAGDHGQLGGTTPVGYIAGVSMNWMLDNIRDTGILPPHASVYEQRRDFVQDAEGQSPLFKLFSRHARDLVDYTDEGPNEALETGSAQPFIVLHRSVEDSLLLDRIPGSARKTPDGAKAVGLEDKDRAWLKNCVTALPRQAVGCPVLKWEDQIRR